MNKDRPNFFTWAFHNLRSLVLFFVFLLAARFVSYQDGAIYMPGFYSYFIMFVLFYAAVMVGFYVNKFVMKHKEEVEDTSWKEFN